MQYGPRGLRLFSSRGIVCGAEDLEGSKAERGKPEPARLEQLDDWENKWFVLAEVTLRRHHSDVADAVFLNLSRTSGPELTVSVADDDEQDPAALAA